LLYKNSLKKWSVIFKIDPHAAFAAPDDDENKYQGIVSPFRKGGEGDLNLFLLRHCE